MKISNLEYVESVDTTAVVGGYSDRGGYGGGGGYRFDFSKRFDVYINEYANVYKNLYANSYVSGNSAIAEADAEAYGPDSNAEGFSYTYTDPYASAAGATSISQS